LKIHAFIFTWPRVHHRINLIVDELRKSGVENISIISSGQHPTKYDNVSITNIDIDSHYGRQFYKAAQLLEGDVMLQIQGDISMKCNFNLQNHLSSIFQNPEIGIWTPDVNFTSWVNEIVQLDYQFDEHPKIKSTFNNNARAVLNSDCTFWAIRSNLIQKYLKTPLVNSNFGWGIDLTLAALAYSTGQLVIREDLLKIIHPRSTAYNQVLAIEEWVDAYKDMGSEIKPMLWLINTLVLSKSKAYNKKFTVRFVHLYYMILKILKLN
jgi:hypothetical protein